MQIFRTIPVVAQAFCVHQGRSLFCALPSEVQLLVEQGYWVCGVKGQLNGWQGQMEEIEF